MKNKLVRFHYVRLAYQLLFPVLNVRLSICIFIFTALPLGLILKLGWWGLYIWISILILITVFAYLRGFIVLCHKKDAPEITHHYLQQLDSKFYGISREILYVETQLLPEGYTLSRHNIVITAIADKFYSIEHSTLVPHVPTDDEELINLEVVKSKDNTVELIPVIITSEKNKLFWQLNFLPCLPKGKKLQYSYAEATPKNSFAMTLDELKKRKMDYESYSMRISYPTEYYKQKIIFPLKFDVTYYDYDVWLGEGRVRHYDEFHRIRDFWHVGREKDGRMYIEISVKHPIHGLVYALIWTPPRNYTP